MASLIQKIFSRLGLQNTYSDTHLSSRSHWLALNQGTYNSSGIHATPERALGLTALFCAWSLKSGVLASLPLNLYQQRARGKTLVTDHPAIIVLKKPNPYVNAFQFRRAMALGLSAVGNGVAEIQLNAKGQPQQLWGLKWNRDINATLNLDGTVTYRSINGIVDHNRLLHIAGMSWDGVIGVDPIRSCAESIGAGLAVQKWGAAVFGSGAQPGGFLKVPGGLSPEALENLKSSFLGAHSGPENFAKTMLLEEGIDFVANSYSPETAQLILSRTFTVNEVSRITGVPTNLLHEATQGSYNSNEESNTQWYQASLRSDLETIEAEFNSKLLTDKDRANGLFFEHRFESLLRGNAQARSEYFSKLFQCGFITENEVRESEGLDPVDGGDVLYVPANLRPITVPYSDSTALQSPSMASASMEGSRYSQETPNTLQDTVKSACRELVKENIARLVRREFAAIAKQKPRGLSTEWVASHLESHKAFVASSLAKTFETWNAIAHTDINVERFAAGWVDATRVIVESGEELPTEEERTEQLLAHLDI